MGKKDRTFANKMAQGVVDYDEKCPVCGEAFKLIRVIASMKTPEKNSYRFKENMVKLCKCNEKEIYAA